MTEETTTTQTIAPAPKAKKRATKKTAPKPSKNGQMHPHKLSVLKAVKKHHLTINGLAEKIDLSRRATYHAIYHLREDGYIKPKTIDVDGAKEIVYELMAKGSKAIA